MSGYVDCACRDCFEIAIAGDDDRGIALCSECKDAGCSIDGDSECDAPHAYGMGDDEAPKA